MKRFTDQNYYELLDIPYDATQAQVESAHALAWKTYGPGSLTAYPLFSTEEQVLLLKKIDDACLVLRDIPRRKEYNESLTQADSSMIPRMKETKSSPPRLSPEEILKTEGITGAALSKVRELRGLTLSEIADKTRISVTYLICIEKEQFEKFPPDTYLRSYFTQYVRALSLDPKQVEDYLNAYDRWKEKKESSRRSGI